MMKFKKVYDPDEKNSHEGSDTKISLALVLLRYSTPPLVHYAPGAEVFVGGTENFWRSSGQEP